MEIINFKNFKLNEDGEGGGDGGGTANATLGNISGMGAITAPPVSADGSINTYTGNGSPTETVGRGSGDLPAYDNGKYFGKRKGKRKKSKNTIISFKDWSGPTNESYTTIEKLSKKDMDNILSMIQYRPYKDSMILNFISDDYTEMGFSHNREMGGNPLEMIDVIIDYIERTTNIKYELPDHQRTEKRLQYIIKLK